MKHDRLPNIIIFSDSSGDQTKRRSSQVVWEELIRKDLKDVEISGERVKSEAPKKLKRSKFLRCYGDL